MEVSLGVSRDVVPAEVPEPSRGKAQVRRTSAGRYLVPSGSVYIFQIRLPKDLCGDATRPVRVSLGELTGRLFEKAGERSGGRAQGSDQNAGNCGTWRLSY